MLDFLLFHPDSPRFYRLAKIGMNRDESWPESGMSDWGYESQRTIQGLKRMQFLWEQVFCYCCCLFVFVLCFVFFCCCYVWPNARCGDYISPQHLEIGDNMGHSLKQCNCIQFVIKGRLSIPISRDKMVKVCDA